MKNWIIILGLFFTTFASAQKIAYVDTKVILEKYPNYKQAQERLNDIVKTWQKEIEEKQNSLDSTQKVLLNEKVLLTENQLKDREKQIETYKKEVKDLQEKYFGPQGNIISTRMNLVKPIQDRVWSAVQKVAKSKSYSFVFDKASDLIMLYTDSKYDLTNDVIKELIK